MQQSTYGKLGVYNSYCIVLTVLGVINVVCLPAGFTFIFNDSGKQQ